MIKVIYVGQMVLEDCCGLKFPNIRFTGEEKPWKKPHPEQEFKPCNYKVAIMRLKQCGRQKKNIISMFCEQLGLLNVPALIGE